MKKEIKGTPSFSFHQPFVLMSLHATFLPPFNTIMANLSVMVNIFCAFFYTIRDNHEIPVGIMKLWGITMRFPRYLGEWFDYLDPQFLRLFMNEWQRLRMFFWEWLVISCHEYNWHWKGELFVTVFMINLCCVLYNWADQHN